MNTNVSIDSDESNKRVVKVSSLSQAIRRSLGLSGMALLLSMSPVVKGDSTFGAVFELSSLDGSEGFVINGIDAYDQSGNSVSSAGDVNGDGVADVIIGAPLADPNGSGSGESYVLFGGGSVGVTGTVELSSLDGSDGFVINGIDAGDISGQSVSSAGDVNGDGVADLIIGAFGADPNGGNSGCLLYTSDAADE